MGDNETSDVPDRPGPEPERLKLPHKNWKEALKELFTGSGGDRMPPPPEEEEEEKEIDGAVDE